LTKVLAHTGAPRGSIYLATMCLASVEGALTIGRAEQDDAVFDAVKRQLRRLAVP
jgi:hypothetical protein